MRRAGFLAIALCLVASTVLGGATVGTATMDFETGVGLLTEQTPPGSFTASGGEGVFAGPGQNTVFLEENDTVVVTSSPHDVSASFTLRPLADSGDVDICLFVAESGNVGNAVLGCVNGFNPSATLIGFSGNRELAIDFPNIVQTFTLEYDVSQERATFIRDDESGGPESVFLELALDGGPLNVVTGITSFGSAKIDEAVFVGEDIPDFPPVADPSNLFVDFGASSGGNGAESFPFNTLSDALGAADPGGTVNLAPGSSSETLTVNQDVSLVNSNPGGGSVLIGAGGARSAEGSARVGFVSR